MTHDWPVGITKFGNEEQLLRFKPYFKNDIAQNQLGNPHSRELVDEIRPRHWFAGHLHCKFEATVQHEVNENCEAEGQTDFLALHKCNRTKPNKMFFDVSLYLRWLY
jgi:lariat debranching enzyme